MSERPFSVVFCFGLVCSFVFLKIVTLKKYRLFDFLFKWLSYAGWFLQIFHMVYIRLLKFVVPLLFTEASIHNPFFKNIYKDTTFIILQESHSLSFDTKYFSFVTCRNKQSINHRHLTQYKTGCRAFLPLKFPKPTFWYCNSFAFSHWEKKNMQHEIPSCTHLGGW